MITGNPESDFFEQNPELKFLTEIKDAVKGYSKKEASQILWSIYLLEDPNSKFYRIPRENRLEEIKKNYYDLEEEKFEELIKAYPSLIAMSKEERMFKVQVDKLDELTSYLKNLTLSEADEFDKSLKILEKLPKIWDGFEKVRKRLIDSAEKTNIRAGAVESAREKRRR